MTLSTGDTLPEATLLRLGSDGPEEVSLSGLTKGRKVVIFAVPGAFTPTCTETHMPSFVRTKAEFDGKGVDEVVCITVNDPFVVGAWSKATGADTAGITVLGDPQSAFTKAIGMDFDAPPAGLIGRSQRYAMLVEDGKVKVIHTEDNPGACEVSAGEAMLAEM